MKDSRESIGLTKELLAAVWTTPDSRMSTDAPETFAMVAGLQDDRELSGVHAARAVRGLRMAFESLGKLVHVSVEVESGSKICPTAELLDLGSKLRVLVLLLDEFVARFDKAIPELDDRFLKLQVLCLLGQLDRSINGRENGSQTECHSIASAAVELLQWSHDAPNVSDDIRIEAVNQAFFLLNTCHSGWLLAGDETEGPVVAP